MGIKGNERFPMVTRRPLYLAIDQARNLSEKCILKGKKVKKGKKETSRLKSIDNKDGLIGAIRRFFEENGIEVYRINTEPEAYQVKYKGQIIRFYIQTRERIKE